MQFEYLGCVGDSDDDVIQTKVTKENNQNTSFFIQDAASCGFDKVIQPSYKIQDNKLMLSYKYAEVDAVAACICQYQSRFTFKIPPKDIKAVEFKSS